MNEPTYTTPISRRMAHSELGRYVKAEFNDSDCYWFTCRADTRSVAQMEPPLKHSLFARILGSNRKTAPEVSPTIVPCAVLLPNRREDDKGCCDPTGR